MLIQGCVCILKCHILNHWPLKTSVKVLKVSKVQVWVNYVWIYTIGQLAIYQIKYDFFFIRLLIKKKVDKKLLTMMQYAFLKVTCDWSYQINVVE